MVGKYKCKNFFFEIGSKTFGDVLYLGHARKRSTNRCIPNKDTMCC